MLKEFASRQKGFWRVAWQQLNIVVRLAIVLQLKNIHSFFTSHVFTTKTFVLLILHSKLKFKSINVVAGMMKFAATTFLTKHTRTNPAIFRSLCGMQRANWVLVRQWEPNLVWIAPSLSPAIGPWGTLETSSLLTSAKEISTRPIAVTCNEIPFLEYITYGKSTDTEPRSQGSRKSKYCKMNFNDYITLSDLYLPT